MIFTDILIVRVKRGEIDSMPNINIVAHNLPAMFSNRTLGLTNKDKEKTTEKLSSGYKINRGADDASGLAISEKMRKIIRGLNQGSDNITDGISVVHVADGALDEMTSCLQRINELSIKAYNGTNSKSDRESIQNEIDHLLAEIDRTAEATTYNEMNILQSGYSGTYTFTHKVEAYHWEIQTDMLPSDSVTTMISVSSEISFDNFNNISSSTFPVYHDPNTGSDVPNLTRDTVKATVDVEDFAIKTITYGPLQSANDNPYTEDDEKGYIGWRNYSAFVSNSIAASGKLTDYGPLSSSLDQNASAIINFEGIASSASGEELYNNLIDLLGMRIGVPCMTDNSSEHLYGINFTGQEYELGSSDCYLSAFGNYGSLSNINLSAITNNDPTSYGYDADSGQGMTVFEQAKKLIADLKADPSQTSALIPKVPQEIAKFICKTTAKEVIDSCNYPTNTTKTINGNSVKSHYNRAMQDSDYSIVIYDFRDKAFFGDDDLSGLDRSVYKSRSVTRSYPVKIDDSYTYDYQHHVTSNKGIWIQCSSDNPDGLTVDLPYISTEVMGIDKYNINKYTVESIYDEDATNAERERAAQNYEKEMAKYREDMIKYQRELARYNMEEQRKQAEYEEELRAYRNSTSYQTYLTDYQNYQSALSSWSTSKSTWEAAWDHDFKYAPEGDYTKIRTLTRSGIDNYGEPISETYHTYVKPFTVPMPTPLRCLRRLKDQLPDSRLSLRRCRRDRRT